MIELLKEFVPTLIKEGLKTVLSPFFFGVGIKLDPKWGEIRSVTTLRRGRDIKTNEGGTNAELSEEGDAAVVPHGGEARVEIREHKGQRLHIFDVDDHNEFMLEGELYPGWAEIGDEGGNVYKVNANFQAKRLQKGAIVFVYLKAQAPGGRR